MSEQIGILGGTFDPIHFGHLAIAQEVVWRLDLARVFFIPAAQQPLKAHSHVATAADRLAMVRLATDNNPAFEVCDLEIARGGRSYSVDTVATLRDRNPGAEFVWIGGADILADLPRWYQVQRLLSMCRFAITTRPGYRLDFAQLYDELPAARGRVLAVEGPALLISATDLRARRQAGAPIRYQLPDQVLAYMDSHGLYLAQI